MNALRCTGTRSQWCMKMTIRNNCQCLFVFSFSHISCAILPFIFDEYMFVAATALTGQREFIEFKWIIAMARISQRSKWARESEKESAHADEREQTVDFIIEFVGRMQFIYFYSDDLIRNCTDFNIHLTALCIGVIKTSQRFGPVDHYTIAHHCEIVEAANTFSLVFT